MFINYKQNNWTELLFIIKFTINAVLLNVTKISLLFLKIIIINLK